MYVSWVVFCRSVLNETADCICTALWHDVQVLVHCAREWVRHLDCGSELILHSWRTASCLCHRSSHPLAQNVKTTAARCHECSLDVCGVCLRCRQWLPLCVSCVVYVSMLTFHNWSQVFTLVSPTTVLVVNALYGLWGGNAPWFMCWFRCYINC